MEQKYSSLRVFDALALASGNSPNPSTSSAAGAGRRLKPIKGRRWAAVGCGGNLRLVELIGKARVNYVVREWPSGAEGRYPPEYIAHMWWSKEHALASIAKYKDLAKVFHARRGELLAAMAAVEHQLTMLWEDETASLKAALENKPAPPEQSASTAPDTTDEQKQAASAASEHN